MIILYNIVAYTTKTIQPAIYSWTSCLEHTFCICLVSLDGQTGWWATSVFSQMAGGVSWMHDGNSQIRTSGQCQLQRIEGIVCQIETLQLDLVLGLRKQRRLFIDSILEVPQETDVFFQLFFDCNHISLYIGSEHPMSIYLFVWESQGLRILRINLTLTVTMLSYSSCRHCCRVQYTADGFHGGIKNLASFGSCFFGFHISFWNWSSWYDHQLTTPGPVFFGGSHESGIDQCCRPTCSTRNRRQICVCRNRQTFCTTKKNKTWCMFMLPHLSLQKCLNSLKTAPRLKALGTSQVVETPNLDDIVDADAWGRQVRFFSHLTTGRHIMGQQNQQSELTKKNGKVGGFHQTFFSDRITGIAHNLTTMCFQIETTRK